MNQNKKTCLKKENKTVENLLKLAKAISKCDSLEDNSTIDKMQNIMKGIKKESDSFFQNLSKSIEKLKKKSVENVRDMIRKNKRQWEKYYNNELVSQGIPASVKNNMVKLKLPNLKNLDRGTLASPHGNAQNKNFGKRSAPQEYQSVTDQTPPPIEPQVVEQPPAIPPSQPVYQPQANNLTQENPEFNETNMILSLPKSKIEEYYMTTLQKARFVVTEAQIKFFSENVMENQNARLKTRYRMGSAKNYSVQKFYEKLKDEAPVLVLCEAENGHIFGGVSHSPMDHLKNISEKNFIFSLSNMCRHDSKVFVNDSRILEKDKSRYGPVFGENDLLIGDNCGLEASCESYFGEGFDYQGTKADTYLGGARNFRLKNIIIFRMKY